ncbi:ubiquinone biosynthesis monooxygenase Coq7 [Globodera pallida]|nr:ubiquinone biosynthesis monooxygenase Coq7 [Globodera pallida]
MNSRPLTIVLRRLSSSTSSAALPPYRTAIVHPIVRVDHAGELAADSIYAGQLAVLPKNHRLVPVVEEMRREEKRHLDEMERLVAKYGVRPTALAPICSVAGFLLGAGTALMGEKAAMACEAPFYGALKTAIQTGCKTAIWITQRI